MRATGKLAKVRKLIGLYDLFIQLKSNSFIAEDEYRQALDVARLFFGTTEFSSTTADTLETGKLMNLLVLVKLCNLLHNMHRYEEMEPFMAEFYHLYLKLSPTETR